MREKILKIIFTPIVIFLLVVLVEQISDYIRYNKESSQLTGK